MLTINLENSRYIMPVKILTKHNYVKTIGIVDTGAKGTIMPPLLLDYLSDIELIRTGIKRRGTAPGAFRYYNEYLVDMDIDGSILNDIHLFIPIDAARTTPLLGINILSRLDMYQLGGSYQLHVRPHIVNKSSCSIVTTENSSICLQEVLNDLGRMDLYKQLLPTLPTVLDMSYTDFYNLITSAIRNDSLT